LAVVAATLAVAAATTRERRRGFSSHLDQSVGVGDSDLRLVCLDPLDGLWSHLPVDVELRTAAVQGSLDLLNIVWGVVPSLADRAADVEGSHPCERRLRV